jgi:signal peptidase I
MKLQMNILFWGVILGGIVLVYNEIVSFELFMLLLLVFTGAIWLADRFLFRKKRAPGAAEPEIVDYARSFFPVILVVFLLRSFLVEPFKIPSGSMMPTLLKGDFILVNKFTYGIRLPVLDRKVVEVNNPRRGDVMVFRYPENPSVNYIKRVIGVPGDVIEYRGKQLFVNGAAQQQRHEGEYNYMEDGPLFVHTERYTEDLSGHAHPVLINPERPTVRLEEVGDFPRHENCSYTETSVRCTVPPGNYFMMGDNRDNSRDSRYWGFVPDNMIVGKAFAIWMNWGDLKRIGSSVN